MQFDENHIYHIFNRGNDKQPIFFTEDNYLYFLKKVERYISPCCNILSYCLMPNHFHFLVYANEKTLKTVKTGSVEKNILSEGIKNLLSTYAQAINKRYGRTGSLFTQNTCSQCTSETNFDYSAACFHYIHQNPLKAQLVTRIEDWPHSSFNDFKNVKNNSLCNISLACDLLDLDLSNFYVDSYKMINNADIFFKE